MTRPPHRAAAPRRAVSAHRPAATAGRRLQPTVVALGGGHGLSASLNALQLLTDRLTAVVTVADNGGSSGRIRQQVDVLPPGDLRMALAALCDESEWGLMWRDVVQHRFTMDGELDGHALGNLMILTMWQLLDDPIQGLDWIAGLLGASGRVLPMALDPLDIEADVTRSDGSRTLIRGQKDVAVTTDRVDQVRLIPADPRVPGDVLTAVAEADWIVLGPGSWYTSVVPHLLVPALRRALEEARGHVCLTMNLAASSPETSGLTQADLFSVVCGHAPELRIDAVVADPTTIDDLDGLLDACAARGTQVLLRQVSVGDGTPRHDPVRLAAAYRDVFDNFFSDVGKD